MRWRQGRRSTNVEDRRGSGPGKRRLPGGAGLKLGGGAGIIVMLLGMFLGVDLSSLMGGASSTGSVPQLAPRSSGQVRSSDEASQFVTTMLGYNEDVWTKLFKQAGQQYRPAKLVIFDGGVNSACGYTSSAAGPFYCPGDYQVYIDLNFFRELEKMGAGGDFAQAYVLAHEVGHHVQNLLGVSMAVQKRQRSVGKTQANQLSVRAELQADCYAGVWAHHAHKDYKLLEPGDLEEGMNAAARIGDDALMGRAGARVRPEAFTHGSSKQRQEWLYRGLNSGDAQQCDSFAS